MLRRATLDHADVVGQLKCVVRDFVLSWQNSEGIEGKCHRGKFWSHTQ